MSAVRPEAELPASPESASSRRRRQARRAPRDLNPLWENFNTYVLPAILLGLTCLTAGSYYETNDDVIITFMLRGIYAAEPVTNLHLFYFGIGHLISTLYGLVPLPWYAIGLYSSLYLALVLNFGLLHRLSRKRLTNEQVSALLIFFYILVWFEHAFSFNYTRVPILLAAAAFLNYSFADKTPGTTHNWLVSLNLAAFVLALCIRPNAAVLGLLVALPGAIRVTALASLDVRNLSTTAIPFIIASVLFILAISLLRSDESVEYYTVDRLNMMYSDFGLIRLQPATLADTARAYAVREWMIGDRGQINEAFFHRVGTEAWGPYLSQVAPAKVKGGFRMISKSYSLIIILNAVIVFLCLKKQRSVSRRRLVWITQAWVLLVVLVLAAMLKLPPRLMAPMLTVLTFMNLLMYFRRRGQGFPKLPALVWVLLAGLSIYHVYSTGWRIDLMGRRRRINEAFVTSLGQQFQQHVILVSSFETYLSGLSPWTTYNFGENKVLPLTGWNTLDPSYRRYYTQLSGEQSWPRAVLKLAYSPNTIFFVPLGFTEHLNRYLRAVEADTVRLQAFQPYVSPKVGVEVSEYLVGIPPGQTAPAWRLPGRLLVDTTAVLPAVPVPVAAPGGTPSAAPAGSPPAAR